MHFFNATYFVKPHPIYFHSICIITSHHTQQINFTFEKGINIRKCFIFKYKLVISMFFSEEAQSMFAVPYVCVCAVT